MPKANTIGTVNLLSSEYIDLYVKILSFLVIIYIGYYFYYFIASIIQCKKRCHYLVQEGYSNFDDSKAYFSNLTKRCNDINNKLSKISGKADDLETTFGTLQKDICYVTSQVDESLAGNYASNVPDEEKSYSDEEQKKRADQRKGSSAKYVQNLKKTFSQTHNNVTLLECFEDSGMTGDETLQLKKIRENLISTINDVKSNLLQFDNSIISLQKSFSTDILQKYYVTLNYNDKYIKQLQKAVEGFEDVFDFKPSETDSPDGATGASATGASEPGEKEKTSNGDLEKRVNALESHFVTSLKSYETLQSSLLKYTNTIKKQTIQVKKAKLVVTDQDEQTRQINANADAAKKSA